jgi:hypothetical protein
MSKIISKEELKKHTEDDDQQWLVVEGKVIDVTKYKVRKREIKKSMNTQVSFEKCKRKVEQIFSWNMQDKKMYFYSQTELSAQKPLTMLDTEIVQNKL